MEDHPEAKKLLADFISSALVEQPVDVFDFARNHFKGTATVVAEAEDEEDLGGVEAGDQDDLDDLDAMAGSGSELNAYLKEIFDSMDTDGSGSISKEELKVKLAADNELQTLLEAAGGERRRDGQRAADAMGAWGGGRRDDAQRGSGIVRALRWLHCRRGAL